MWRKGSEGSVSVYGIILILPIFLFHALFIDLIRIRTAARETETALKAGLRSTLSRYDRSLQSYGLYGLMWDPDRLQGEFHETVEHNLSGSAGSSFRYTDTRQETGPDGDDGGLTPVFTLANHTVLERQIEEEMKVKAPVEMAVGVWNAFKRTGTKSLLQAGSDLHKQSEELEELFHRREEALDRTWDSSAKLMSIAEAGTAQAEAELVRLQELAGRIGLHTLQDVQQAITDIDAGLESAGSGLQELRDSLQSSRRTLEDWKATMEKTDEDVRALKDTIVTLEEDIGRVEAGIQELAARRDEWKTILSDMLEYAVAYASSKAFVQEQERLVKQAYEECRRLLEEAQQLDFMWEEEMGKLKGNRASTSPIDADWFEGMDGYGAAFFIEYHTGAAKISAAFHGMQVRWSEAEWWGTSAWDALGRDAADLRNQISLFKAERDREKAKRNQEQEGRGQVKADSESQIGTALQGVQSALGGCGAQISGEDPFHFLYERLQGKGGIAAKYRNYNRDPPDEGRSGAGGTQLPERNEATGAGFDLLDRIADLIGEMKDDMLMHEYILGTFTNRTTGLAHDAVTREADSAVLGQSHLLANQEAEYALYGLSSCMGNQGAAYAESFTFFFAIRTLEKLMEPRSQALQAGTPLLAMLAAAAQGALSAVSDVNRLVNGEPVILLKKFNTVSVTYKDMLRLFMLLHGNDSGMLSRLQALVELNTDKDLTLATTYLQGTARTSVGLWFLPGLLKLIHRTGYGCQVEKRRCTIKKNVVHSYD